MPECIELRIGRCRCLLVAHLVLAALTVIAIVLANTSISWKLLTLAAFACVFAASIHFLLRRGSQKTLHLFSDGRVSLRLDGNEVEARLLARSWLSRWLTLISIRDIMTGQVRHCLVCASRNTPDNYRRLLLLLRVRHAGFDQALSA